jgi:hypothetical protein
MFTYEPKSNYLITFEQKFWNKSEQGDFLRSEISTKQNRSQNFNIKKP